ncbi:histidine phosphatase family protein [Novosphingobium beihaiensis]|uniref:Histidine phosphatase family protein n=1 Tax=Novosphingobium beihaiensis TaxID=2930389 RepID=A0ABT0BQ28_9SPHN|nr:histidine phosphatase family protein [Novosphingobium beihaiensis]MCJ2187149.1 histidine phosphatase family protein [Novosphingobium beihaiensis]
MIPRIVHLLRHGPPARTGLLLGHLDEPPRMAECPVMLGRVAHLPVRQIVSSDLRRTGMQAAYLAERLDVPFLRDPCWRELDFGAWDGQAPENVDAAALSRFWEDPDANPPPQGERWSHLCARVREGLAGLENETLAVTHAGAMRAALSVLTGLDHRAVWAVDLPYRALVSLRIWPGEPLSGQIVGLETGYRE